MENIFSENPENDLWRELSQFTYEANIKRYLEKRELPIDEDTIKCISGSFLQAYEYYMAAKDANLQISPLLLYYGSTNLLYGMTNLLTGSINRINNHGMKTEFSDPMNYIADTKIRFLSPIDGGVHVFARVIGFGNDLTSIVDWKLRDFFDSIAEIQRDYTQCYGEKDNCIIMLDVFDTPDGKAEKVYFSDGSKNDILRKLSIVEGFDTSYLNPLPYKDVLTGKEYFVLRHKLNGKEISKQSYSGQPYLQAGHQKNKKLITIPELLNIYISLFSLSSLCRYFPERWSPFVLGDTTGEKLLIEKFMFYARRLIPNFVLNQVLGTTIQYSSSKYSAKDTIKKVGEHQIQEIVRREIQKELIRQEMELQ